MLAAGLAVAAALASPSAHSAAGVVVGVAGRVVVERPSADPKAAAVGMRLDAADVVVLDAGASASIYVKGGSVVRLHDATRYALPKTPEASAGGAARATLASGTIAQLESGLWVLNDPAGSLLVSPMRGDAAWESSDAAVPLSPRFEALVVPRAVFVWTGGPAKARVVVSKKRETVWTSPPSAPGAPLSPGAALPLAAGEVYTWWLEPEAGGPPLTAGIPFRVATAEVIERTQALEAELRSLAGTAEGAAAADYLLLAHYAGAASWTRVAELASRLAPGEAKDRALAAAADGLRLDARTTATLAERLASRRPTPGGE